MSTVGVGFSEMPLSLSPGRVQLRRGTLGEGSLTSGDPQSWGEGRTWHPKVANPGPQPLACSAPNSCGTSGEVTLQLLQACLGMCAPHHISFLRPGGSLCSDVKLVGGTVKAQPRKCTGKLLKEVGGCAIPTTPHPDSHEKQETTFL